MSVAKLPANTDDVVHALELAASAARSAGTAGAIVVLIDEQDNVELVYSHDYYLSRVHGYLFAAQMRAEKAIGGEG